jgi:hypothetical protein
VVTWTPDDIARLKQAIADGGVLKSMTFADQTYEFRDLDEMLKLLGLMEGQQPGAQRTRYAAHSKGV